MHSQARAFIELIAAIRAINPCYQSKLPKYLEFRHCNTNVVGSIIPLPKVTQNTHYCLLVQYRFLGKFVKFREYLQNPSPNLDSY